jgi:hypothetical protein
MWSHILGWPGVIVLLFGGPQARRMGGGRLAFWVVTCVAIVAIVTAAILGEISKRRQRSSDT